MIMFHTKMSALTPYKQAGQRHYENYTTFESSLQQIVSVTPQQPYKQVIVVEDSFSVWIVGSSIIKDLYYFLADKNFGLSQIGGYVEWNFKSGLREHQLVPVIQEMLAVKPPPYLLIVHCGGNDIGEGPCGNIQRLLKSDIEYIKNTLPETRIVFSAILPRLYYRCEVHHNKLDKARKRLNTDLSKFCMRFGGGYIRYPEIKKNQEFFRDFVHLSQKGQNICTMLYLLSVKVTLYVILNKLVKFG